MKARLKIFTVAIVVCLAAGVGWVLRTRFRDDTITDRAVMREALAELQRAGEPGGEIGREIFEQQARRGYYDDALWTGRLFLGPDGAQWSVVELARIRCESGDLQGAMTMIERFQGPVLGARIAKAIALVQESKGDLNRALEIADAKDRDEIFLAYAKRQIANGEFAAALETAALMQTPDEVFYDLGEALQERREQNRVRELASGMRNRKLAAQFKTLVRRTLWPPRTLEVVQVQVTPCEVADDYVQRGRFAEADALIERNECGNVSFVAIRQYAVDPVRAERLLRSRSNGDDLLLGLDQLTIAAAKKGNVPEAMRFLRDLQNLKGAEARVEEAVQGIARYWAVKDGPKEVLKWARARPTSEQRSWALLGVAQGLEHPRPAPSVAGN